METIGYPDIAINSLGKVAVAFPAYYNGVRQIYVRASEDYGSTWGSVERVTNNTYNSDNPAISVDEEGNMVVVYMTFESGVLPQLYETHKLVGESSWSTSAKVSQKTASFGTDLVSNGTFESWTNSVPQYWSTTGSPTVSQVTSGQFQGTLSVQLTNANTSNLLRQSITIPSTDDIGQRYLISVAAMAVNTGDVAYMRLLGFSNTLNISLQTNDTGVWQILSGIIEKGETGSDTGNIEIYAADTGDTVRFDAVHVYPIQGYMYPEYYPNVISDDDFGKGHVNVLYVQDKNPVADIRVKSHTQDGGADVTEDVESLRISRDKEFKTGKYGAGDFSMSLANAEGIYTNEKVDSPFYKRLKTGLEVEIELGIRQFTGSSASDLQDPA